MERIEIPTIRELFQALEDKRNEVFVLRKEIDVLRLERNQLDAEVRLLKSKLYSKVF